MVKGTSSGAQVKNRVRCVKQHFGIRETGLQKRHHSVSLCPASKNLWREKAYKLDGDPGAAHFVRPETKSLVLLSANFDGPDGLPDVLSSDLYESRSEIVVALFSLDRVVEERPDTHASETAHDR